MSNLVFYTNPMSRGRIARWMLEEVGATYDTEVVEYGPPMKSAPYADINPMGKVPALRHGDLVVTEAAAIVAYLADAYPQAGLAPPVGSPERGAYYRWMFFAAGPLEQATVNKAMGYVPPDDPRKLGTLGYGTLDTIVSTLETLLRDRNYVLGDTFSAVDVYLGAHLTWDMQFETIPRQPVFEAYSARITARPAHKRAMEIDDALMPPRSAS